MACSIFITKSDTKMAYHNRITISNQPALSVKYALLLLSLFNLCHIFPFRVVTTGDITNGMITSVKMTAMIPRIQTSIACLLLIPNSDIVSILLEHVDLGEYPIKYL